MKSTFDTAATAPQIVRTAYERLKTRFHLMSNLFAAAEMLGIDAAVTMPSGSGAARDEQFVTLSTVRNEILTAPETARLIKDIHDRDYAGLSADEKRNATLMRRMWVHASGLPPELVAAEARIYSEGERLHTEFDYKGDWARMESWYQDAFDVARRIGQAKQPLLNSSSPYEALLDFYAPGFSDKAVSDIFASLEAQLPAVIAAAVKAQAQNPPPLVPQGPFPVAQQQELVQRIARALGFDDTRGGMYLINGHPSMVGVPDDARLTYNLDENNFIDGVFTIAHEVGHAMYIQNLPSAWRYQPAGDFFGMALHESQARVIEVQACHTSEFFQFLEREARDVFGRADDPSLDAANLERLANRVQPSLIRTEADEVTYPAHIILRHKLEKALINGEIEVADLPRVWNENMERLLGVTPPDTAKGCQQDVHWPCAMIGYFPAYTLGDIAAAQFFAAACRSNPDIKTEIAKGNFKPLTSWLRENVQGKGSLLDNDALFVAATGKKLDTADYIAHIKARYLGDGPDVPQRKPVPKGTGSSLC